jgi:ribonucleoside-diphosphate reductase alpha chain
VADFDLEAFRAEVLSDPLVQNVWENKYRWKSLDGSSEASIAASQTRVINAVYANDPSNNARVDAFLALQQGYFLPGGRINAGAGTSRRVTLLNCYVGETIQDSMQGIQRAIMRAAFTLQQGGGIGHDFSTLRPAGAIVRRTGSVASGPIPYMDQMSAMSETVCSAGERRGAMMMTLADWHPDLWHENQFETFNDYNGRPKLFNPSFISVKRQQGRLTQTNISVLVSDSFMQAVHRGDHWDMGHWVPRADGKHVDVYERRFPYDELELDNDLHPVHGAKLKKQGEMHPFYVYQRVPAQRIWHDIMEATYKYAEPGVLYIDKINARNNLSYCEDIVATNPCGEQPLPPFGCCCLGSVNAAFMVLDPFTENARFDWNTFHGVTGIGVRFLDNVLDIATYPLEQQQRESMNKRRIGLGLTGVADACAQLRLRYGSWDAIDFMRQLSHRLRESSYITSAKLASERSPFPLYNRDDFMKSPNVQALESSTRALIEKHGIRNGVLNTVAPNGTISTYSGNTGQGIEPVYAFGGYNRKVRQPDGKLIDYKVLNYAERMYAAKFPNHTTPAYFVGAEQLTPSEHIRMQAACQEGIDASISKTVNCPTSLSFADFVNVYMEAYQLDCKGCTTYRPDPDSGRGSVLSIDTPSGDHVVVERLLQDANIIGVAGAFNSEAIKATVDALEAVIQNDLRETTYPVAPRASVLAGHTYKLKWPTTGANWYITINHDEDNYPSEVFIVGSGEKAAESTEWIQATSRLLTAVLRRGGDIKFLVNELAAICSSSGGAFIKEQHKHRPSIVAAIGGILETEFRELGLFSLPESVSEPEPGGRTVSVPTQGDGGTSAFVAPRTVGVTIYAGGVGGNGGGNASAFAPGIVGVDTCPQCYSTPLVHEQGCLRCLNCDWNKCG